MRNGSDRVWFMTGASSGVGRRLAERALGRGRRVVATARNIDQVRDLEDAFPGLALAVRLDVTDTTEIDAAVQAAVEAFGGVDVLVNNAGYGQFGALEEVTDAQIRRQFETNVFGTMNVTRRIMPLLRQQGSGHIINISSVSGRVCVPGLGAYSASKFALEGLSETLAVEMAIFGVGVTIIELGGFETDFGGRSLAGAEPMAAYDFVRENWELVLAHAQYGDLDQAVQTILDVPDMPAPPLRIVLGPRALDIISTAVRADLDATARWEEGRAPALARAAS